MDRDDLLLMHRIKPEGSVWLRDGESVLFQAFASVSSLVLRFTGYALTPQGAVVPVEVQLAPTSDRAATEEVRQFGECFILGLACSIVSGNADRGQCFVRARIQRGSGSVAIPLMPLIQHYVTDSYSPVFPYSPQEDALDGPGNLRSITGTNPAAGVEVSETVPTGARWKVWAITTSLTIGGVGANEESSLTFDDGTTVLAQYPSGVVQGANDTTTVSWSHAGTDIEPTVTGMLVQRSIAQLMLKAGYRIRTVTGNFAGTSNYAAPQLLVEEWLEA